MKQFLRHWLDCPENKKKPYLDTVIIFLIILSVITTFLQNTQLYYSHHKLLDTIETVITILFTLEYSLRFFIATDFLIDIKRDHGSFLYAINQKILWAIKPFNIIDLLALIPEIRFFRLFRILRLLRAFKQSSSIMLAIRSYKQETRVFVILFLSVLAIVIINSFLSFIVANPISNDLKFTDFVVYHLKLLDFATDENKSIVANVIASTTLLLNITFIAIFISLITTKMESVMTKIKEGHLGKISLKNHIVLCGFSACSAKVIAELLALKKSENIVLVTERENPDISGIIYYHGDYSDIKVLRQVNVKESRMCIVFSEINEHDTVKSVDLRTVLTVFNIEQENSEVHTIAEIINQENGEIIRDKIMGDEIIYKEMIDASLICNCVRHPYISPLIYDMLNIDNRTMEEATLADFGINYSLSYKELKLKLIDKEITLLGVIDKDNNSELSPKNDTIISSTDRLLYLM
ncbi:MAG: ion transporter [Deferribacterales bacterium]